MISANSFQKWVAILFLLTVAPGFLACRTLFQNTSPESLRERVDIVWKAKVQSDWGPVYDMADSQFQKNVNRNRFVTKSHYRVKSYEVIEIKVNQDNQTATSHIQFDTEKMGMPFKISTKEAWIVENGQWRLQLSNQKTPFS